MCLSLVLSDSLLLGTLFPTCTDLIIVTIVYMKRNYFALVGRTVPSWTLMSVPCDCVSE